MSKERLEEIKQRLVLLHNAADVDNETKSYIFEYLKVEWIIERVQELEEHSIEAKEDYEYLSYHYDNAVEQNKRYREALEEIDDIMRLKLRCCKEDMHIMNALEVLEESE